MAVSSRAPARGTPVPYRPARWRLRRALAFPLLLMLVAGLTLTSAAADLETRPVRLTPEQARDRGQGITLRSRVELGERLLTVALPAEATGRAAQRRLLAVSEDADLAVVADRIGPDPTELVLVRADEEQLRIPVPGVLAASLAADGGWVVALDGSGTLLRISTADGSTAPIAAGPFLGAPLLTLDGGIIALAVASVEAPFTSTAVRIDPATGAIRQLVDEELVYAVSALDDGGLAVVAHRPDGTRVLRLDDGAINELASLEPGAVHVAVAPDGGRLAWERAGDGIYVQDAHGKAQRIGPGSRPRFSPDGRTLLADLDDGTVLMTVDGRQSRAFAGAAAAFVACAPECGS